MDEARRVIDRLERIERLRQSGGHGSVLLAEVRLLLEEGEAWLAAEPAGGADGARAALDRCRSALEAGEAREPLAEPAA